MGFFGLLRRSKGIKDLNPLTLVSVLSHREGFGLKNPIGKNSV